MKVLIVGSGGREHAIAYKCSKEQQGREDVLCTGKCRNCRACRMCTDSVRWNLTSWSAFAKEKEIDLCNRRNG